MTECDEKYLAYIEKYFGYMLMDIVMELKWEKVVEEQGEIISIGELK